MFEVMLFNVHEAVRHAGKAGTFQNISLRGNSCQSANIHLLLAFILSEEEEWLGVFIPLCQCPVITGETDDGARVFNSQITGVQQGNLPPSLRRSLHLPPSQEPKPKQSLQRRPSSTQGVAGGEQTHSALTDVFRTAGSTRNVFSGQTEPGMVLEVDTAGGSRHSMSQAEHALPCIPSLEGAVTPLSSPSWCPDAGRGGKTCSRSGKQRGEWLRIWEMQTEWLEFLVSSENTLK